MNSDPIRSLAVEPPESYANALQMTSLTREQVQSRCLVLTHHLFGNKSVIFT